jgi:hypothetical protein
MFPVFQYFAKYNEQSNCRKGAAPAARFDPCIIDVGVNPSVRFSMTAFVSSVLFFDAQANLPHNSRHVHSQDVLQPTAVGAADGL